MDCVQVCVCVCGPITSDVSVCARLKGILVFICALCFHRALFCISAVMHVCACVCFVCIVLDCVRDQ